MPSWPESIMAATATIRTRKASACMASVPRRHPALHHPQGLRLDVRSQLLDLALADLRAESPILAGEQILEPEEPPRLVLDLDELLVDDPGEAVGEDPPGELQILPARHELEQGVDRLGA